MKFTRFPLRLLLLTTAIAGASPAVFAGSILFIGDQATVRGHLETLGHTVTLGSTASDFDSFDQVWDVRTSTGDLTSADQTKFVNYLSQGGRVLQTGENFGLSRSRNVTLVEFFELAGAGTLSLTTQGTAGSESFTALGQSLYNIPNAMTTLSFNSPGRSTPGNGFTVTGSPSSGVVAAWDFGDLVGNPNARMAVIWDSSAFSGNGINFTENTVTFLGAASPLPEPAGLGLFAAGLVAVIARRRQG